jgi:hypothetical protein
MYVCMYVPCRVTNLTLGYGNGNPLLDKGKVPQ